MRIEDASEAEPMNPQTGNDLPRWGGRSRWFRDKTNGFLFGLAALPLAGIAAACLGAFSLNNDNPAGIAP